jgi:nucleoside-diphosphate-sugar epimerase
MRILVTGGAGYIGTPLCTELSQDHEVVCWDPGFFGFFFGTARSSLRVVERRVQELDDDTFQTLAPDVVLHLSGLSNDPMADFAPRLNWAENTDATGHVARLAARGGARLVFASSASVYGFSPGGVLDETAPVAPIGHYSESKAAAEQLINAELEGAVILRQATVMGVSPRMRFDLLTNGMTRSACVKRKLRVLYGGREVRAQVHVRDLVSAYRAVLDHPTLTGTFNVSASNDRVLDLGETIRDHLRAAGREVELDVSDEPRKHRSYALTSDKFREATGWAPRVTVLEAVDEVATCVDALSDPFDLRFDNIGWMKSVLRDDERLGEAT